MAPSPTIHNLRRVWWVVAAVVAADQLTKWWAMNELDGGRVIKVLPTLEFDLAFNPGFSFGTGGQFGPWIGGLVFVICLFLIGAILRSPRPTQAWILAAILGGALGNLIDRVVQAEEGFLSGRVTDFIDVTWYAVFNVADICVVCGSVLLVLTELRVARSQPSEELA